MIAETATALGLAKQISDFVKASIGSRDEKISNEKLAPVLQQVTELQHSLSQIEIAMMKVERENEVLKRELQKQEDWKAEKARYKLEYFPTGQMAYTLKEPPEGQIQPVYFCMSCMDNDNRISQLTYYGGNSLTCRHCNLWFEYKPSPTKALRPKIRGGVDN